MTRPRPPLSLAAALAILVSSPSCAREARPPGAIGSIDASSSRWRPFSSAGAPPPAYYYPIWTPRGLAVLAPSGAGGLYDPSKDTWRTVPAQPAAVGDGADEAIVLEQSILFTGGSNHGFVPRAFDLAGATWRTIPEPPGGVRVSPALAWTGSTLFVWGGAVRRANPAPGEGPLEDTAAGAILDVASGTSRATAREGAPSARTRPLAVWTGSAFFVWGGQSREDRSGLNCEQPRLGDGCEARDDGAIYDPARDRWSLIPGRDRLGETSAEGVPPHLGHPRILWTGSVVLLWDRSAPAGTTVLYAYDPRAGRWLAPLAMPVALTGQAAGVSGGRVVFLDQTGSHTLDLETRAFSPISLPEDIRRCWHTAVPVFEAARVVVLSPPGCQGVDTLAVSALDPRRGTWRTANLPPVPRPRVAPGAPKGIFGGRLVWTGEHLIAWGDTYQPSNEDTSCAHPPPNMPCDPVGPKIEPTSDGFILRPSL
jgi:hypothetical protein